MSTKVADHVLPERRIGLCPGGQWGWRLGGEMAGESGCEMRLGREVDARDRRSLGSDAEEAKATSMYLEPRTAAPQSTSTAPRLAKPTFPL